MSLGRKVDSGLHELGRFEFYGLKLPNLEWIAREMGVDMPSMPRLTAKGRISTKYHRTIARKVEEAFSMGFCFYVEGDRHYWVIGGNVWYFSVNIINLSCTVKDWNSSTRTRLYTIPEDVTNS